MAAGGVRYTPDYRGVGRLLRSAEMEAMLLSVAKRGAAWLSKNTPQGRTGELRRGYSTQSWPTGGGKRGDRAHAEIRNEVPYILAVEFGYHRGGSFVEGHHMMKRAVDHM